MGCAAMSPKQAGSIPEECKQKNGGWCTEEPDLLAGPEGGLLSKRGDVDKGKTGAEDEKEKGEDACAQ